jgi:hypothetical protein
MNVQPFSAIQSQTQAIVPTNASQTLTFNTAGTNANCYYVYNASTVAVAVKTGLASAGAVTAVFPAPGTPGDLVVPPGSIQIFSKGFPIDTIAIIGAAGGGSGNVYVTPGEGQ